MPKFSVSEAHPVYCRIKQCLWALFCMTKITPLGSGHPWLRAIVVNVRSHSRKRKTAVSKAYFTLLLTPSHHIIDRLIVCLDHFFKGSK